MLKLIKVRVIVTVVVSLALGVAVTLWIVDGVYDSTCRGRCRRACASADDFALMRAADVKMMSTALEAIAADERSRDAFRRKDRDALAALSVPLFNRLKARYGITLWHFLDPEARSFLRVHEPKRFGDVIDHATVKRAMSTGAVASGTELGKMGFALRVAVPYLDRDGTLIGYLELGEEIDYLDDLLKKDTGAEVALLADKKFLEHAVWTSMRAAHGARDDWDDRPDVVLVNATSPDTALNDYAGALTDIPADGAVIGRVDKAGRTLLRGVVPFVDAAGNAAGGILAISDVTDVVAALASARLWLVGAFVAVALLLSIVVLLMLQRLVFARLDRIIAAATNLVGGDFDRPMTVSGDDEVGQIERLYEQFRVVFVSTIGRPKPRSSPSRARTRCAGAPSPTLPTSNHTVGVFPRCGLTSAVILHNDRDYHLF